MTLSTRNTAFAAALTGALLFSGCKSSPAPAAPGSVPPGGQTTAAAPAPAQPAVAPSQAPGTANGANQAPPPTAAAAPAALSYGTGTPTGNAAATPSASAPAPRLIIPAGTRLSVRTTQTLAASRNEVGDGFSGVLNAPVTVRGSEVLRRGAEVRGTIVASKGRGRFKGAGGLGIELTSVAGYRVTTSEYERVEKGRGKRTAGFIVGGGGVGALIGGLAGGGKGALIGGLAGAGAGTAAGAYTGKRDVVIPAESLITFTTRSAIQVR